MQWIGCLIHGLTNLCWYPPHPTKIKLNRELMFHCTVHPNSMHILMQELLKSMIN